MERHYTEKIDPENIEYLSHGTRVRMQTHNHDGTYSKYDFLVDQNRNSLRDIRNPNGEIPFNKMFFLGMLYEVEMYIAGDPIVQDKRELEKEMERAKKIAMAMPENCDLKINKHRKIFILDKNDC